MSLEITVRSALLPDDECIAVFVFDDLQPESSTAPEVNGDSLRRVGFTGKAGECYTTELEGKSVTIVGLGSRDSVSTEVYRRAGGVAVRAAKSVAELAICVSGESQAVAEGAMLGSYKFLKHKSKPEVAKLSRVRIIGADEKAVAAGTTIATAVNLARDLINEPANTLTPRVMARVAADVANSSKLDIEVWDHDRIVDEKLGGLLGVSSGSEQPPQFVKLSYSPENADENTKTIALVGKGITFDSGGLNIKPGDSMTEMKTDMAGAAAVLATMSTLHAFKPNVRVRGYMPISENLLGANAMKPGDVLRARNGKTMEVLNTDAEGRLILADALSIAVEEQPDFIVDLATLTGACKVALGNEIAGLFGTSDELLDKLESSSLNTSELTWRMPLHERYKRLVESNVADIKNMASPGGGGLITSALFLREFVADVPWAHFDIAGPGRGDGDDAIAVKGGTGFGVRLLVDFLRSYAS